MAKRTVIVVMEVDPTEYEGAQDTPTGAIDLVADMLSGGADIPERFTVLSDQAARFAKKT